MRRSVRRYSLCTKHRVNVTPVASGTRSHRPFLQLVALVFLLGLGMSAAQAQPHVEGQWAAKFDWPNVAIHVHLLKTGKVLFWGRRDWKPDGTTDQDLHQKNTTPQLWDPQSNTFTVLPKPGYNLFCSGHAYLPDGKLFVAGGHLKDSSGDDKAIIFNPDAAGGTSPWEAVSNMNAGRWYPNVCTLSDGAVLVTGGQKKDGSLNKDQQIYRAGMWQPLVEHNTLPLYPRMYVFNGEVFLAGALKTTQLLNTSGTGSWKVVGDSAGPQREEGCAVYYGEGQVLIVGGGRPPQATAETIDLTKMHPQWQPTDNMSIARRHHNATLLPDGTVLITGGTSGNGGFNDLTKPVKFAENWDPKTGHWTKWAAESQPRLYHSTAILLPDARVLSAGGGEFALETDPNQANDPADSHRNGQIFSPPYLFKSTAAKPRPDITAAPASVGYNEEFNVSTSRPDQIARVTWVRLSSVTHSSNMNQRFNELAFTVSGGTVKAKTPIDAKSCPPGHYLLFLLNDDGVPSVAKFQHIQ